ncbi:hypothetical protein TNCV_3919201 [Trichonephila clavipes]|nr:hypothetical protein TNCV_3919201 [Trichonephila clavipes]
MNESENKKVRIFSEFKKRKKAQAYNVNDPIDTQHMQVGSGLNVRPKPFEPGRESRQHKSPGCTSTAADHMNLWCTLV